MLYYRGEARNFTEGANSQLKIYKDLKFKHGYFDFYDLKQYKYVTRNQNVVYKLLYIEYAGNNLRST